MSQWQVELTCKRSEILSFLSTTLQEPLCTVKAGDTDCYYINPGSQPALAARKTSGYFLLSSEFDSLIEDGQVRNRAMEMLPFLNALVKLKISAYAPPLEIDDVFLLDAEGRMIWEGANVTWTLSSLESNLQKVAGQPLNFIEIWHLSQKSPEVDEALHQLANETNWFNLYKVYEVIRHDVGEKTLGTWTHGKNIDFKYSANNIYASQYAARHSSVESSPSDKRKTMAPSEGAEFITDLFLRWLQSK